MAISFDQPISAANLKAVVEKLMGGGDLPETLVAVSKPVDSAYAPHPLSYYSKFEITTAGPYYTETIPAESGVHVINGKSVEIVDRGTYVYFKGYTSSLDIIRIVGYR